MVRCEDLEALADTVECLSNPAPMQIVRKYDEDIHRGYTMRESERDIFC